MQKHEEDAAHAEMLIAHAFADKALSENRSQLAGLLDNKPSGGGTSNTGVDAAGMSPTPAHAPDPAAVARQKAFEKELTRAARTLDFARSPARPLAAPSGSAMEVGSRTILGGNLSQGGATTRCVAGRSQDSGIHRTSIRRTSRRLFFSSGGVGNISNYISELNSGQSGGGAGFPDL